LTPKRRWNCSSTLPRMYFHIMLLDHRHGSPAILCQPLDIGRSWALRKWTCGEE